MYEGFSRLNCNGGTFMTNYDKKSSKMTLTVICGA